MNVTISILTFTESEPRSAQQCPENRKVHIKPSRGCDIGILHYTSDTPYNRWPSLLSQNLGYSGLEATYACSLAIVQIIIEREIARIKEEQYEQ